MDTTYQGLRTRYAELSDDDLRHFAVTAADLTEDAQRALQDELEQRGIAATAAYQAEIDARTSAREEYLRQRRDRVERGHRRWLRISLGTLAVMFGVGAWRLTIAHDRTNGVGIMLACAIVAPIVLAHAYLRRALLRSALR
jgi:hypothetical protein